MNAQEKLEEIEKIYNEMFYEEGFIDDNFSWLIGRVKTLEKALYNIKKHNERMLPELHKKLTDCNIAEKALSGEEE